MGTSRETRSENRYFIDQGCQYLDLREDLWNCGEVDRSGIYLEGSVDSTWRINKEHIGIKDNSWDLISGLRSAGGVQIYFQKAQCFGLNLKCAKECPWVPLCSFSSFEILS